MSSAVAKLSKPVMRGMHVNSIKKNIAGAALLSVLTTAAWYVTVNKARIDNYKNFYKNYDAEADFQRMKKLGVFQSCALIEEKGEE